MKVGLDVLGGDFAPESTISGAIQAQKEFPSNDRIVLIGPEDLIRKKLEEAGVNPAKFIIEHAPDMIEMGDHPTKALTLKPRSTIAYGYQLLKDGQIDAFASAGNSGAMMVGAIYSVNTIQGIIRPTSSVIVPKENGRISILLDVGTNPDPKPDVLYQFGILGSIYAQYVYHIENPRVGLLNIGTEAEKGNLLYQSAYQLMKGSENFNFVGNIEGRDVFKDKTDVIVCDGFTGNVILKLLESVYRMLVKRGLRDDYIDSMNYENYGGTPLLGINSSIIMGHGISNDVAIKNMIKLAREVHEVELSQKIQQALLNFSINKD
jgi:glycerol-3-phosphate acyltransferase PlsX